jgi:hypothetical protein
MENRFAQYGSGRFFFGLILLILGSLFLLDNLGYIYVGHLAHYWPALFILFGIVKLLDSDSARHRGNGIGWIFLGSWFLVSMNGIFDLDFHNSWPILIIGWGISMLWKAYYRQPEVTIGEEQHHGI